MNGSITDIPGIRVGHAHDEKALTGCTVILCEAGATGGVDQRGGAPGTRETDLLHSMHLVEKVHAVLLTGGSAFGLDAASGVMRYLEERGAGFDASVARVPIVPAAVLFDLGVGDPQVRPDAKMGYQACLQASDAPPEQGNAGAGMGATVGKILGMSHAMKTGIGSASLEIGENIRVAALVAVNAFGDVIDPGSGQIIAGVLAPETGAQPGRIGHVPDETRDQGLRFADTINVMRNKTQGGSVSPSQNENTVIGVVATNARLNKEMVNKTAQMAHDGLARAIRPAHTLFDGDTIFALATGEVDADPNVVGTFAAQVFADAILQAVYTARPAAGLPAGRTSR